MRVLIADERSANRRALRALLEHDPGCSQIIETIDAPGTLAALAFEPDLLLLEWGELPGMPLAELLAGVREQRPQLVVIVLGRQATQRHDALAAGADQFLDMSEPPAQVMRWLHGLCAEAEEAAV